MRRDMTVGAAYDRDSQRTGEGERAGKGRGRAKAELLQRKCDDKRLKRAAHTFSLSRSLSVSRSVLLFVPLQLGQLEMLIAEMKYFGDKRVPDEPPL